LTRCIRTLLYSPVAYTACWNLRICSSPAYPPGAIGFSRSTADARVRMFPRTITDPRRYRTPSSIRNRASASAESSLKSSVPSTTESRKPALRYFAETAS